MSPILEAGTLDFITHSETQTRRLGTRLGQLLRGGEVLALIGQLGTGKTRWAQGVALGLDIDDVVNSPTFTLVNEYEGRLPFYHIDLYRLAAAAEALTFGLDDYLYGHGVCVIEWADRAPALLPAERLEVELHHLQRTKRRLVLRPRGSAYAELLQQFKEVAFAR
ncbi:MAG: tRNA (adenosine(37)-N6)-threonylcarbamoyltransferase complex ATPase subunit type 1 TsaE [Anaerolineae bacterium]